MSFDEWLLALHVLSAFFYVAGIVVFWILIVAVRQMDTPDTTIRMGPIVKVGNASVGIGGVGTIVLGIWLAFALDSYAIWDGWINRRDRSLGDRRGFRAAHRRCVHARHDEAKELEAAGQTGSNAELLALNRTSNGVLLHALASASVLLILLDMIFKPGA